ncbi:MAG: aldolase [Betaproteobacteria bacterium]|nr:aldolase [Betaproteobacteria bacterium]
MTAKDKLARGELVLCMGLRQARTLDVAMIAAQAGFDCVYVDMEHSPISLETTSSICAGCHGLGITPLVRPPSHAADWISRALDGGAQGLIVPHVSNGAQAKAIVAAARFPPLGSRSVMGPTPALGYKAMPLGETNRTLNAQTLLIVMIETPEAVERADEIAALEGIDMLLIGSNDLCTELGIPGELRHPKLRAAYEAVARACKKHGKTLGVGGIPGDQELQKQLLDLGARFIIAGNDVSYLAGAARADVQALRKLA